jgi:hypothetical protein
MWIGYTYCTKLGFLLNFSPQGKLKEEKTQWSNQLRSSVEYGIFLKMCGLVEIESFIAKIANCLRGPTSQLPRD